MAENPPHNAGARNRASNAARDWAERWSRNADRPASACAPTLPGSIGIGRAGFAAAASGAALAIVSSVPISAARFLSSFSTSSVCCACDWEIAGGAAVAWARAAPGIAQPSTIAASTSNSGGIRVMPARPTISRGRGQPEGPTRGEIQHA